MRIVSSAKEMTDNVQSLLELFRNTLNHKLDQTITLNSLLKTIHSEFILAHASYRERIQLASNLANTTLNANPTLVKMLINNLLMNALKHTQGNVLLSCHSDHLDVQDKGQWKNLSDIKIGHPIESEISSGLGLYIVSLICKHLDWRLDIQSQEEGTSIKVWFT
jgi:signal transduction histidine kinase